MKDNLFDINNFNIIQDEENYYFFRALNMADNNDIEQKITISSDGKIERIRTDRERFDGEAKYTEDSKISLEELYDHIKMHYRKDTNCISLTSNANIAINYGRGSYKDKYVMIKIPKKELGSQIVVAGQYMLRELSLRIERTLETLKPEQKQEINSFFTEIEDAQNSENLQEIIAKRYTSGKLDPNKAHLRKGITYSSPKARISSYQSLGNEQLLELNKVYAKLAILENKHILEHAIPHSSNSKLRETIGNAFSSAEVINYGDIKQESILEIPKEVVDIFALIQQVNGINKNKVEELKRALILAVQSGKQIPEISEIDSQIKDNLSIEEMYELTGGKVEYGKANSIVKNMFYLSKSRKNAIELSNALSVIFGDNSEFEDIIQYIRENGFRIEPEIISRQSGKGVKISESVSLNLQKEEHSLVVEIKKLSTDELEYILKNGGLSEIQDIVTRTYGNESSKIDKSRYYAEAIISQYNWQEIGIEEFKITERNELIKRLQNRNCIEIYNTLKQIGIKEKQIPTYLLNIATRQGLYERYLNGEIEQLLSENREVLKGNLNIEVVERFLGYYDVEGTKIKLKKYQQRAFDNVDKIFESHKFAQVILPTGAGKSFVALTQMQQYAKKHPNEKMLYLAPQDEILNQIKNYIVKYIHGKKDTVGKSVDEIVTEVFPNITFETYSGLLIKRSQEIIKDKYGMIVLDELHRTGAKEWEEKIDALFANQEENVKVLGITATPVRDVDGRDMAEENARKLGYTDEEIQQRKHLASNMTLENAIKMGYVVNPKLVYCKYDLISSGKIDALKAQIDSIEDESKRNIELQKYHELKARLNTEVDTEIGEEARKRLEEDARRNLERGIGKEEILRQNIKKGEKYIVFIPVSDQGDIEDEDGNRIGKKTGEDKLKAYQEYLNKVFEGTDIMPQCHAMSGSWNGKEKNKAGEDKNQQELDAFESDNSDETKFMVVMNKANEGLHIEGVDGIIWFRALDENSRILYLQQLGRAIYALDEDNPLPDDKRPIVIDLVNNSLTVKIEKDFENVKPIDDLEALTIVKEWIEQHNGMLPDRNSSNKQEQHYYAILRRIQNKYIKYLNGFDNFEDLNDEQKEEIQQIIDLATEIDLWNIDLPPILKIRGSKDDINPFEVSGILRDYVEIQEEINGIEKESAMSTFVQVCESLSNQGFDFRKFLFSKTIEKRRVYKTLEDVQQEYSNIDIDKVLEEARVSLDYSIGVAKHEAVRSIKGKGTCPITEKEKKKLIQLGVIKLEKENIMTVFVRVCEELAKQGVEFDKFSFTKQVIKDGKKETVKKTLEDVQREYPNIDISQVIEKTGVELDYSIGNAKAQARQAVRPNAMIPITEDEKQKLIQLGVINLENAMSIFVRVCESLASQGFNFNEFKYVKTVKENGKGKTQKKTLADVQQECPNIDITRVIEETGVTLDYSIGNAKVQAVAAAKGRRMTLRNKEEMKKLIDLGVISLEKENAMSIFVRVCESLASQGFNFNEFKYVKTVKENGKVKTQKKTLADVQQECPNIDITRVIEETGVTLDYSIGNAKAQAVTAAQGKGTTLITKEETKILMNLGIIRLEKERAMSTFVRVCESLASQNFNFDGFKYQKTIEENGKKKTIKKTLADIQQEYHNIDISKVIEETGVKLSYSIGSAKEIAVKAYQGKDHCTMTDEERKKLIQLGIINLDKKSAMSIFVQVCEELAKQGFKFDKFSFTKQVMSDGKKKTVRKTLEDIHQEYPNIDINKVIEETGVTLDYSIENAKAHAVTAAQGKETTLITESEKERLIALRVINIENKLQQAKQQRDEAKDKNDQAKELEKQVEEQLKKRGQVHEEQ